MDKHKNSASTFERRVITPQRNVSSREEPQVLSASLIKEMDIFLKAVKERKDAISNYRKGKSADFLDSIIGCWNDSRIDLGDRWESGFPTQYSSSIWPSCKLKTLSHNDQRQLIDEFCKSPSQIFCRNWVQLIDIVVQYVRDINPRDTWIKQFVQSWNINHHYIHSIWQNIVSKQSKHHAASLAVLNAAQKVNNNDESGESRYSKNATTSPTGNQPPKNNNSSAVDNIFQLNQGKGSFPAPSPGIPGTSTPKRMGAIRSPDRSRQDTKPITPVDASMVTEKLTSKHMHIKQDTGPDDDNPGLLTGDVAIRKPGSLSEENMLIPEKGQPQYAQGHPPENHNELSQINDKLHSEINHLLSEKNKFKSLAQGWEDKYNMLREKMMEKQQKLKGDSERSSERVETYHTQEIKLKDAKISKLEQEILQIKENMQRDSEFYTREIESLRKEKSALMDQLSASMNTALARDETDLENINVMNRPMKILEQFELFLSEQWLNAKTALDDNTEQAQPAQPLAESHRCLLLCGIIKLSYEWMLNTFQKVQDNMSKQAQQFAAEPLIVQSGYEQQRHHEVETKRDGDFEAAVSKFLKRDSQKADFNPCTEPLVEQVLKEQIQQGMLSSTILSSPAMLEYARCALSLCWRMILQQPPMTLDFDSLLRMHDIGERAEPHFGSANPSDPSSRVHYYVYPAVFHGKTQMKKARVFLVTTHGKS